MWVMTGVLSQLWKKVTYNGLGRHDSDVERIFLKEVP